MHIIDKIVEWRKNHSRIASEVANCAISPETVLPYSTYIDPQLYKVMASLYGVLARVPPAENNWLGSQVLVEREHLVVLLNEYFKLDRMLREHFQAKPSK